MPLTRLLRPLGLAALLVVPVLPALVLPAAAQYESPGAYLAAREAERAGDYAAVVRYGSRALGADPDNTGLLEGLVMAHLGLGEIDAALPAARHLASLDDGNQVAGLVLLAEAIRAEDWGSIGSHFDSGVTVGLLMDDMVRAWSAIGAGQMSEALALFDALIDKGPTGRPALLQKALALALVGDYEGAAEIFSGSETVLRLNRAGVLAYVQVLSQLERNPDAADLLDQAFPGTEDPQLITLGEELRAGKPIPFSAIEGPRQGIAQLFYEVGESLRGETDPGLVLLYARIANYLDAGHVGATLVAAQVLDEMENHDLAAEAYARVPQGDLSWPQAQLGRASALSELGRTDDAIAVLTSAVQVHPETSVLHAAIGDALRGEQRYAEATPHYDAAIALYETDQPGQWRVYFARGITFERRGMWPEAEADFRKALELSPEQPSVLNYLGYSLVERRESFDEALDMIKRAVGARPYDGYIRDSLGWVYYRLGRYEDAVEEMERAVELLPLEPVLNDHLGDTFWAVGREREARFQWRRALSFIADDTDLDELDPDRIRRKLEVGLDAVLEEEDKEAISQ